MPWISPLNNRLSALSNIVARCEIFICQFLIICFVGLLLANVTMRYLFTSPIYFAEELAVYILIWMAFLAIAATIARQEMISLEFLAAMTSPLIQRTLRVVVDVVVLGMVLVLTWVSWRWLFSPAVQYEQALTLGIGKKPFYAIIPIFFTLASLHTLSNLLGHIINRSEAVSHAPSAEGQ